MFKQKKLSSQKSSSKQPAKQAKQPKGEKKSRKREANHLACIVCNTHYGDPNYPKATEELVK